MMDMNSTLTYTLRQVYTNRPLIPKQITMSRSVFDEFRKSIYIADIEQAAILFGVPITIKKTDEEIFEITFSLPIIREEVQS